MSTDGANKFFADGVAAYRLGQFDRAIVAWERLLALAPDHLNGLQLLGAVHFQQSHWPKAEACFRRVLGLRPDLAQSWFNLAKVVAAQGHWPEAEKLNREGLARAPDDARALDHLGLCLVELGRAEEARAAHGRAIELEPDNAIPLNHLGIVQIYLGQTTAAIGSFTQAAEKDPLLAEAHGNLGNAWREAMGFAEAHAAFERAVTVRPAYALGWTGLLLNAQYHPGISRSEKLQWSRRFSEQMRQEASDVPWVDRPKRSSSRIHVGFVSSELFQHAVAHFLLPIFQHYDRSRLEISVFSNTHWRDTMTDQLKAKVDHWHSIFGRPDTEATAFIRECAVDILVDLNGHSGSPRLGIFARRAAPIQVTYLGYPDTTGLAEIDYRLTDDLADPPNQGDDNYAETLWRLSAPAWCYQPSLEAPQPTIQPKAAGAPLVFGCFNNSAKLNPTLMNWWAEILRALPNSRLLLKARAFSDPAMRAKLWKLFSDYGINETRIELKPWLPTAGQHLAEYLSVDIALDTYPYHGTTTTCDALWMGVPVITLAGNEHRSRVGVSLLAAVGLEELVADSPGDYVARAIGLARNRPRLEGLKTQLRGRMAASSLTDGPAFAAKLETAFETMFQMGRAGRPGAMVKPKGASE